MRETFEGIRVGRCACLAAMPPRHLLGRLIAPPVPPARCAGCARVIGVLPDDPTGHADDFCACAEPGYTFAAAPCQAAACLVTAVRVSRRLWVIDRRHGSGAAKCGPSTSTPSSTRRA